LLPEHCTLAPNVKTCDSNVTIFLSSETLAGEKVNAVLLLEMSLRCGEQNAPHRDASSG
jgi:hypothetical protein